MDIATNNHTAYPASKKKKKRRGGATGDSQIKELSLEQRVYQALQEEREFWTQAPKEEREEWTQALANGYDTLWNDVKALKEVSNN